LLCRLGTGVATTLSLIPAGEPPHSRERIRRRTPVLPLTVTPDVRALPSGGGWWS